MRMKRFTPAAAVVLTSAVLFGYATNVDATPESGHFDRAPIARATHPDGGTATFGAGRETVVYTATMAPGAASGWHRHPGAVSVLVKSGTLTTYGLGRPPCDGLDVPTGQAYFEHDASKAPYPHFVRNRGSVPTEIVVVAFDVPPGGTPRIEADAPKECPDPT